MIAFVLAAAIADPELVDLRYQTSLAAWSMCIDHRLEKMEGLLAGQEVPRAAQVAAAMERCYVFGQDLKRTMPDVVVAHLNKDGVKHYSQSVVDMLVDGAFKEAEEHMRKTKEAQ